jgi:hypothetical protein
VLADREPHCADRANAVGDPAMKKASEKPRRGRPVTGRARRPLAIRLDTEMIKAIHVWARAREIERASAIRRLLEIGLAAKGKR